MERPEVHWADTPEGKIAFQVLGDGPVDICYHSPGAFGLDLIWEYPPFARFLRRLASFSRLILNNPRGYSMSDPLNFATDGTAEDWIRDLTWTLDEIGSERAAYLAAGDSGIMAVLWAATFPERASGLVLSGGYASLRRHDDYPFGFRDHTLETVNDELVARWGTGRALEFLAPDLVDDERVLEWYGRAERGSMSPSSFAKTRQVVSNLDVRGILDQVRCPTLVLSHTEDPYIRPGHGRYIAEHIPNARYVERPGPYGGLSWLQDADWLLEETEAFLTGARAPAFTDDRVLATVLFTDIVDSTKRAATLGDRRWKEVLAEHHTVIDDELQRFGGQRVKSMGDGVLATFDGPARAIRCAFAINRSLDPLGISIRTGLHTGEIERLQNDIAGIAVHIGARVMHAAEAGEVLVSGSVPPLVAGSGIEFEDRGEHELKGVPGSWKLFAVTV